MWTKKSPKSRYLKKFLANLVQKTLFCIDIGHLFHDYEHFWYRNIKQQTVLLFKKNDIPGKKQRQKNYKHQKSIQI